MKRIITVLPLAVAWVLFCSPAWAADAVASADITSDVWKHLVVVLVAGILPPFVKAFNEGTQNLKTIPVQWRLVIVGVLTTLGTAVDHWQNGGGFMAALTVATMQAGPALIMELIHAVFGGWSDPGGTGGATGSAPTTEATPKKSMFPPPVVKLAGIGLAMGMLVGCSAAAKDTACQLVKAADELCPYVVVVFPDGTRESVPRSAVAGLALNQMAERLRSQPANGGAR